MKKCLLPILCILILTGCSSSSTAYDLQDGLNRNIKNAEEGEASEASFHKQYYSYYTQPGIGHFESTQYANVFSLDGNRFLMNLNISSVINQKYYEDADSGSEELSVQKASAEADGIFKDIKGNKHSWKAAVYQASNDKYMTCLYTDTVYFYAVSDGISAVRMAGEMLSIARSVTVDTKAVAAAYSNKETVQYSGEKMDLFDSIAPESGRVSELFKDSGEQTQQKNSSSDTDSSGDTGSSWENAGE
jgi:hypothetical protein